MFLEDASWSQPWDWKCEVVVRRGEGRALHDRESKAEIFQKVHGSCLGGQEVP